MVKTFIVNADDLGISEAVNEAIFGLMDRGLVTSASIIVNGPAFEDAVERSAAFPQASFGIHLNTSEFRPLTAGPARVGLVDDTGSFSSKVGRRRLLGPSAVERIAGEWEAQIGRGHEAGLTISHVDSHRLDHLNPSLLPALWRLRSRTGISRVRPVWSIFPEPQNRLRRQVKRLQRASFAAAGFGCPDGFTDLATLATLGPRNEAFRGITEIMVHPGHPGYEDENRVFDDSVLFAQLRLVTWDAVPLGRGAR